MDLQHQLEIDGKAYQALRFRLSDGIDTVPALICEIIDAQGAPAPLDLVGKPLTLTLTHSLGGEAVVFEAWVTEASRTTEESEASPGTTVLAHPKLHRLRHRTNCRVFREQSVVDIVTTVLTDAGLDGGQWDLVESYAPRVHVAQYRETDFDFVRRILAEVGIGFYVDTAEDRVVFFDGPPPDITGPKEVPFEHGGGLLGAHDVITEIEHVTDLCSGKTYLRDRDFERPRLELNVEAEEGSEREKQLEVYDYPGRYVDEAEGDLHARVLLEALRARGERLDGEAHTLRLRVGHAFALGQHPYAPLNRDYLIASVRIAHDETKDETKGEQSTSLRFEALPTTRRYRPAPIPRAQTAPGAHLATTTGPAGAEIHPDEHGRVKVLYPWDRGGKADETASRWVRTSQIPLGGSMLTPRVGWEVCTRFRDGDVDLPLVFGRMYNADHPPPYALPEHKARMSIQTATTPGDGSTNELRMDDTAGEEEMFMNASKDASVSAGNNATEDVGNNETRSVGGNQDLNVTDSLENVVSGAQTLTVGGNQGVHTSTFMVDDVKSHTLSVGGNKDIKAGGDHNRTVTAASSLVIGGMQVDLVAGSVDEATLSTMSDTIGAVLLEMTAGDRTISCMGARSEDCGAAKLILSGGGRSVEISGAFNQNVAGAIGVKSGGGRADSAGGDFLDVAAGAQLIKAATVVFEASSLLSVTMGGSTITLTPASVSIAGPSIKLDGTCNQLAALIGDN